MARTSSRTAPALRGAIIGYGGSYGMGKLHAAAYHDTPGFSLGAICEIDRGRLEAAGKEWSGVDTYTDARDLLARDDIDVVTIVTPHNSHAELAIAALDAGKHVAVEKPMCVSVKESTAMIEAARRNKRSLTIYHNRRWDGDYLTVRSVVEKGLLGKVFFVEMAIGGYGRAGGWRADKAVSGGGFFDWGAHLVDWTLGLIPSRVESVMGYFYDGVLDQTIEDHTRASLRFENGASADIQVTHIGWVGKTKWRILGEKGGLVHEQNPGGATAVVRTDVKGLRGEMRIPYGPSRHNDFYTGWSAHLRLGKPNPVPPEQARRVIGVIEAAEVSWKSGKLQKVPYEEDFTF